MSWTAPLTAVANTALTAAQWNIHVRDNLSETAPAKATTAGRLIVTAGVNQVVERSVLEGYEPAGQSTSSTSYVDLTTVGPIVTITTGTEALVWVGGSESNSTTSGCAMGFAVSGASTIAAADATSFGFQGGAGQAGRGMWMGKVTLTAGSNVFTAKYRVTGGTGTFDSRRLGVLAL